MSRLTLVLSILLALAVGSMGCGGAQLVVPACPPASVQTEAPTIKVTGEAEVRVVPDEVLVTLGVETSGLDLEAVRRDNDALTKKVIAVAQAQGVKTEHIQTEYLNAEPRFRDSYERREFLGYVVRRSLVITLKDIAKFEDLLTGELAAGVNYIHGIEFRTTELRKQRDAARALAVKAAKEKAAAMAGELGQKIGEPRTITEEQSSYWSWYSSWWGSRWGGAMTQNVVQNAAGSAPAGYETVAPGQIAVTARVSVTFDLSR